MQRESGKKPRSRSSLNPTPGQHSNTALPRLTHTTQFPPPAYPEQPSQRNMLEQFMSKQDRVTIPEIQVV